MYILPLNAITTRKLLEGSEHCDLYAASTAEYQTQLSEAYQRFIETWINKIRRPGTQKKHRVRYTSVIESLFAVQFVFIFNIIIQ